LPCPSLILTVPLPPELFVIFTVRVFFMAINLAVTLLPAFMLMLHEPVPPQAPLQPLNFDPDCGETLKEIDVPLR